MSSLKAESVIRSMIHRIGIVCLEKELDVSTSVISAVVKGALLDPSMEINLDDTLTKENVDAIVEKCVSDLSSGDISIKTVIAQVNFSETFKSAGDIDIKRKRELANVMKDIEDEIFDAKCHTREEFEGLYRQIVSSILLRSNMGSPTDITVVKETTAALESVLPPEELGTFIKLPRATKKEQLSELGLLVMGIRLFNRACDKGGHTIPPLTTDLDELLSSAATTIHQQVQTLKTVCVHFATKLTKGVEEEAEKQSLMANSIHAFQLIRFFMNVETEITNLVNVFVHTRQLLAQKQEKLFVTISNKGAVGTDQVFPQFITLGTLWQTLQASAAAVGIYGELLSSLCGIAAEHESVLEGDTEKDEHIENSFDIYLSNINNNFHRNISLLSGAAVPPEEKTTPLERPMHQSDFPKMDKSLHLLEALKTHNFSLIPLQMSGLCPVSLVNHGALIPARRNLGVLQRGNVFYGSFTRDGLADFAAQPSLFLQEVVSMGRRVYALVGLLALHPFLSQSSLIHTKTTAVAVKCDSGCQTELHPIEENIDKKYEWNEWKLRKKALELANMRKKKTHSTQTHNSHFRRENQTQVYLPKTQTTQTKTDSYTNTSKPVTYIRGLRGARGPKATPHQVVDLTLSVGGLALEPEKARHLPKSMHKGGKAGRKHSHNRK
eukprot:m.90573 g.90573  ORF g.90573 m.90573 type:complete len:665 (+) comp12305_c6_seq3:100-2094(+)